ncbi:DegT/DnrJ/EryC1/StrS family aminotransferase [Coleofasciculus sp. H7-2]|uniref:DegT/DnrJ/EryC1/StrS family aminotransferase n=1 Tax=Coleofasciculus sp. H7-2 TaxID=3351545 RepID=UPI0036705D84
MNTDVITDFCKRSNQIPYIDLKSQHASLKSELLTAIGEVIDDGNFILGEQVAEFERQFAQLCGVRYAVGVNSGTDALIFALKAIAIRSGDEVITVPNSFVASASCIRVLGAKPVFVDVGDDYNIDPSQIASAITPKTKAIIPVHLTGRPCNMEPILAIAKEKGIAVVEDAAQAILAEYQGQRVGSFGIVGCFSLHPLKNLNACGDGGVLVTDDPELYEQFKIMRNIGLRTRDDCVLWSHNSRLDTLQAAILLVKLRYIQEWTQQRRQNARYYQTQLADIPEIKMPLEREWEKCVYHTFVIQAERRDELRQFLSDRAIGTAIHYPVPIHLSTAGKELGYPEESFPVTEMQARQILSLPIYQGLTVEQLEKVCDNIKLFYQ